MVAGRSATEAFRRLTRRIGLDGVRLHDLRHTMASLYLEAEILRQLQNALGMLVSRSRWICIPIAFQAFKKQQPYSSIRRWNRPNLLLLR